MYFLQLEGSGKVPGTLHWNGARVVVVNMVVETVIGTVVGAVVGTVVGIVVGTVLGTVVGGGVVVASVVVPPGPIVVGGARVVVELQVPIVHSKLVALKKVFSGQVMMYFRSTPSSVMHL